MANGIYLQEINKSIKKFVTNPVLKNASVSFEIVAINNDSVVSSYQSNQSLVPASTMKLITTATALEVFGHKHQFKTSLAYDGIIDSTGLLIGNIYIIGSGDPTLGSKYFPGQDFLNECLNAINKIGIKKIDGGIIADASCYSDEFVPSNWTWGDIGNYYGAGVTGLSIYDNTVSLFFKSGKNIGDNTIITSTHPNIPNFEVKNEVISKNINSDQAYIFGAPYSPFRIARGAIPLNVSEFNVKASIFDPALLIAHELNEVLKENNVQLKNPPKSIRILKEENKSVEYDGNTFHQHLSPPLKAIINNINLISNNHFAEHIHRALGFKLNKNELVTAYSSSQQIKNYWINKGLSCNGFYMSDGSGLSRNNAVSASFLVDILCYMKTNSPRFSDFFESLPVAGKTGTLKYLGKGTVLEGKLMAKSGSIQRVRSYAGYYKPNEKTLYAFAVIVNNYNCSGAELKKLLEKLFITEFEDL